MAKLRDLEIDDYLKQCIELEPEVITEEMSRISADYAYWNEKYAMANRVQLEAEFHEKKTKAQLYLKHREPETGKKAPTVDAIDAMVTVDPLFEEAHMKLIAAQAEASYLKGVLETLRTKREMLISVGAHKRQEEKGDVRMMEKRALERAAGGFAE